MEGRLKSFIWTQLLPGIAGISAGLLIATLFELLWLQIITGILVCQVIYFGFRDLGLALTHGDPENTASAWKWIKRKISL